MKTLMQPSNRCYTPWVTPPMTYRLACCDCGLVHNIQFRAVNIKGKRIYDRRRVSIQFRVRRNERSTALVRRHPQKKT